MANSIRERAGKIAQKVLTDQELRDLLAQEDTRSPSGLRNKALLALLATSGLRLGEALGLRTADVTRNGDEVTLLLAATKAGVPDKVVVVGVVAQLLLRWMDRRRALVPNGGALFCTITSGRQAGLGGEHETQPGRPLSAQYVQALVRRLAEKAGIERRVTPHCFRHTVATRLVRAGKGAQAQKLLRHASWQTTQVYLHLCDEDVRDALEDLPRVL